MDEDNDKDNRRIVVVEHLLQILSTDTAAVTHKLGYFNALQLTGLDYCSVLHVALGYCIFSKLLWLVFLLGPCITLRHGSKVLTKSAAY